jgi:methylenetetrahydrofolate reductase (NADPH)
LDGLPVTVGLPGLASAKTLLKYAMDCGVGASLQAFSKRAASLTKLLTVSAPDDIIVGARRIQRQDSGKPSCRRPLLPFWRVQEDCGLGEQGCVWNFEITNDGGLRVD